MRQVTGSNRFPSANKVSIQLTLDGHSFSVTGMDGGLPNGDVEVDVLTPRTLLVPVELFDAQNTLALLAAAGISPTAKESVVWSDPHAETVALMAIGTEALREVREKLGERAHFTSPLLHMPPVTAPIVWLCRMPGVLYIKVYREGLQFAEAVPAATDADILYFAERLEAQFPLKGYALHIAGNDVKALRKLLSNHFREITCE